MANTIIRIKSSGVTGNVPATLQPGELAINYFDGQLFYGNSTSQSVPYATVTEPAGLNGELQFNDSGSFGSDATLSFNSNTKLLIATAIQAGSLNVEPAIQSAYLHANSAYDYANALSGGTATDGIARSIANSAYVQANSSFQNSNSALSSATSAGSYANSAYTQANTSTTNAATADQRAVTSGVFANAAFLQANTATTNAATADQRAVTSGSYANSAYGQANTGTQYAQSAGSYANSAYGQANTGTILAQAAFDKANTGITDATDQVARNTANASYVQANTATTNAATADQRAVTSGSYANSAFVAANTADQKAVSAGSYANSAHTQANSNFTSAVTRLSITNSGASAYLIDQYSGNNPAIYVSAGETIAFLLNNVVGHPFMIRVSSGGSNYDTGLTHVDASGTVLTGSSAQGQINGTLYWKVPFDLVGSTYVYQCSAHSGMVGNIVIQQPASFVASNTVLALSQSNGAFAQANTAGQRAVTSGSYANSAFASANTADQKAVTSGSYANSAFVAANNAITYTDNAIANLVNSAPTTLDTLNELAAALGDDPNFATTISTMVGVSGSYANSAYLQANTATTNSATADQKAVSAGSYANSAYGQANTATTNAATADQRAVTSGVYANSAYSLANTNALLAQAAFDKANTGTSSSTDTFARTQANSAYNQANTGTLLAQSAYDFANTLSISGGSSIGINNDVSTNSDFYVTFTSNTSGIVTSLNTSDTKLGYNPSTGTLKVESIDVTTSAKISSNTVENTTGTQFIVDSFSVDDIRSAFYQVQIESSNGFEVLNLNIVHDDSNVSLVSFGSSSNRLDYGELENSLNTSTNTALGQFTATIVGNVLNLLFTPSVGYAVVSFIKNAIRKIAQFFPTGDLGFVGDNATAFYDLGYVADGQTSSVDYGGLN
jgi:hypothetical protein